ncbi:hypothetical protein Nmel_018608 [Mimus melanotis]
MNLLALGKSLTGHIAATASSAGSEVGDSGQGVKCRDSEVWRVKPRFGGSSQLFCRCFAAGLVPQAAAEAHHVSQERAEAAPVPARRGEGKCHAENKGVGDEICDVTTGEHRAARGSRRTRLDSAWNLTFIRHYQRYNYAHLFFICRYIGTHLSALHPRVSSLSPLHPHPSQRLVFGVQFSGTASGAAGSVPGPSAGPQSPLPAPPIFTGMGMDEPRIQQLWGTQIREIWEESDCPFPGVSGTRAGPWAVFQQLSLSGLGLNWRNERVSWEWGVLVLVSAGSILVQGVCGVSPDPKRFCGGYPNPGARSFWVNPSPREGVCERKSLWGQSNTKKEFVEGIPILVKRVCGVNPDPKEGIPGVHPGAAPLPGAILGLRRFPTLVPPTPPRSRPDPAPIPP